MSDGKTWSLSALAFTFGWFAALLALTAITCERSLIYNDCLYLEKISLWPPSVTLGAFFVTFSASFSHLIGASRVLEAVAKDVLFGPFLNFIVKGSFENNPVVAVLITWIFVQSFFFLGKLNAIAQHRWIWKSFVAKKKYFTPNRLSSPLRLKNILFFLPLTQLVLKLPHYAKLHNGWDLCNKQIYISEIKRPEIVTGVRLKGSFSNFWNLYSRDIWRDTGKNKCERNTQDKIRLFIRHFFEAD